MPFLDSSEGSGLLRVHASAHGFSPAGARDGLWTANGGLQSALTGTLDAGEPLYVTEARAEAAAWAGTSSWLDGLRKLPLKKKATAAAALHASLFPDGLAFVRLPTAERWSQTERRLAHVKDHKLEADFAALGGADVLAALIETHAALGAAAGITSAIGFAATDCDPALAAATVAILTER